VPNAYIVAGPNGAGKTTFAREYLPSYAECRNFINADLIAQGISPFAPEAAAFRAGKIVLAEFRRFAERGEDFGFETTLSGRTYFRNLAELKSRGYRLHIFFLLLANADVAVSRIRGRVLKGGHNVPEADVRRRFERSLRNFIHLYRPIGDSWMLFDSMLSPPAMLARGEGGRLEVIDETSYNGVVSQYESRS
jgi:predicted ABC-type ATPase